jgi:hypothetical protein
MEEHHRQAEPVGFPDQNGVIDPDLETARTQKDTPYLQAIDGGSFTHAAKSTPSFPRRRE